MKMFDADKTRTIGLPYGEKNYDNMLSHFHLIPECDGQTDKRAIKTTMFKKCICCISNHIKIPLCDK